MGEGPTAEERLKADIARFEAAVPYGAELCAKLEADGSRIQWLWELEERADTWMLGVDLGRPLTKFLQEDFAYVFVGPGVGARPTVAQAEEASAMALTPTIFVTVSELSLNFGVAAPNHPAFHRESQHVHWKWGDRLERQRSWRRLILSGLRNDDLFEQRNPVPLLEKVTPLRLTASVRLRDQVMRGQSLGCFGLRKAGKTSLVLQSVDRIYTQKGDRVCRLDVQGVAVRTLRGLCLALLDAMRLKPGPGDQPLEWIDTFLREHFSMGRRLWIVLDEYDLLFATPRGRAGFEGIERFFSLLRAHAQQSRLLSLVVIGRDPSHAQRPTMEGAPNPLLGWLRTEWVGPLVDSDARTLFTTFARRVCLDAGPATVDAALRWTGAHPLLLRQFGSALRGVALPHIGDDAPLPTDPFVEQAIDAFLERDAVLEMCREVEHLLAEVYPDAAALFWSLVGDASPGARPSGSLRARLDAHGGWRTPQAQTLRNLGLLQGTADAPTVPELWRWWSSYLTWRPSVSAG